MICISNFLSFFTLKLVLGLHQWNIKGKRLCYFNYCITVNYYVGSAFTSDFILMFSYLQQLREKKREKRAAQLLQQDDDLLIKLENAAIERSKSVDTSVLGKYSIWRKENENENSDSTVRLMRDQMIMARAYLGIAKMKNKLDLHHELQIRLKEIQRALGEASTDADLHRR